MSNPLHDTRSGTGAVQRSLLAQYGLGSLATGIFSTVPSILLLYYMTSILGIPPALAGVAVSLPKLLDVIVDPFIGSLSDRTRSRWGRRRPYLLAGTIVMSTTFVLLFAVPDFSAMTTKFWYVTALFTLSAAAYSVFAVPYISMTAEMSTLSEERATVVAWRMLFALAGILLGSAGAPFVIAAAGGGRFGYAMMSLAAGLICALSMLAAFFAAGRVPAHASETAESFSLSSLRTAIANTPFFVLLLTYVVQLTGLGVFSAAVPYFASYILAKSDSFVGLIFLCMVSFAALSALFWPKAAALLGSARAAYGTAVALYALANVAILLSGGSIQMIFPCVAIMGIAFGGMQVLPFAMMTDTIAFDTAQTGLRREGLFTGLWTAGEKAGLALGPLIAGLLLSASGFIESTRVHLEQPTGARFGIWALVAIVPALFLTASLLPLSRYSIPRMRAKGVEEVRMVSA